MCESMSYSVQVVQCVICSFLLTRHEKMEANEISILMFVLQNLLGAISPLRTTFFPSCE